MIVGALRDCFQIQGASDVKADSKVCRVLGRTMFGEPTDPETAGKLARLLYPKDPWQLDWPLWNVAKDYCYATAPACSRCYLYAHCEYALKH